MPKTAVYSWRLSPDLKLSLEEVARENKESVAELLERIVRHWLDRSTSDDDEERQLRLQGVAARFLGAIDGDDPDRASTARQRLRERLDRRGFYAPEQSPSSPSETTICPSSKPS